MACPFDVCEYNFDNCSFKPGIPMPPRRRHELRPSGERATILPLIAAVGAAEHSDAVTEGFEHADKM